MFVCMCATFKMFYKPFLFCWVQQTLHFSAAFIQMLWNSFRTELRSRSNVCLFTVSLSLLASYKRSCFVFFFFNFTNNLVKKNHTTLLFHFSSSSNPHSQGEANFTHFGSLTKYRPQMKVQVHGNTIWKFNEASDFPKVLPLYTAQINCEALFLFATAFNVRLSFQILSCTGSLVSFSA